jgi:hypothetical protein
MKENMILPKKRGIWIEPFEKCEFIVEGQVVTIVYPQEPLAGRYWAWKGEFLNAFPATELALLQKRDSHSAYGLCMYMAMQTTLCRGKRIQAFWLNAIARWVVILSSFPNRGALIIPTA